MTNPQFIVGVDEVGCGAIAGPLVVAALAFPATAKAITAEWKGIRGSKTLVTGDSKKIKLPEHRAVLDAAIRAAAVSCAVIERTSVEIDARLLGQVFPEAIRLAASRCLEHLWATTDVRPSDVLVLIDGDIPRPSLPCEVRMIPSGDQTDWRIGAASIVAKACHDRHVRQLADEYPGWEFDKHRGYPTPRHKALLNEHGLIEDVHRKTFAPVRASRGEMPGFEQ